MANHLAMDKSFAINSLRAAGYSERRIAETGSDDSNSTKAPTGSGSQTAPPEMVDVF